MASEVAQSAVRRAAGLRDRFGVDVLAVAPRTGIGAVDATIPLISLDLAPADSMMSGIRTGDAALADPPGNILAAIDAWDPGGRVRVLGGHTSSRVELLGRRTFGARLPSWAALEDKLAIEEVWDAAGVATAPSVQVVVGDRAALLAAHRRLATAGGTVWAGDNASGWHGGAAGTCWVPDEAAVAPTIERLAEHRRVRVMPFIEGVPCSIHGMVVAEEKAPAVLRPCEMMVLRDRRARRFVYARASTYWDPEPRHRAILRHAARRIGAELSRRVGYRGVYTVDGVLGRHGFVPTEVNTRFGAALPTSLPRTSGGTIDLLLVNHAVVEGALDDLDPEVFEAWAVAILDGARRAGSMVETPKAPPDARRGRLSLAPAADGWVEEVIFSEDDCDPPAWGPDGSQEVGTVEWGTGPAGGLLHITLAANVAIGPPTAPLLVQILEVVGRRWPLGLPRLEAAAPVG